MILPHESSKTNPETAISPPLLPAHVRYLRERAVSEEAARAAGLRSVSDGEASELLGYRASGGGLAIPYPDVDPAYCRIRLDQDDGVRFLAPKNREVPVYVPPNVGMNSAEPIVVVEGPIKALALSSHGFTALGLGGTGTTLTSAPDRSLNQSWERVSLKGRRVVILFDSNRATNLRVARDEARLAMALEKAGADVFIGSIEP